MFPEIDDIKVIAYVDGAFYVSVYGWHDPVFALRNGSRSYFQWIGSEGWYASDEIKEYSLRVQLRYPDMLMLNEGEYVAV